MITARKRGVPDANLNSPTRTIGVGFRNARHGSQSDKMHPRPLWPRMPVIARYYQNPS